MHIGITLCYASLLVYSIEVIQMYSAQHKPSRKVLDKGKAGIKDEM